MTEEGKPLTAKELWKAVYDRSLQSQGETPWKTIESQIYVNILNQQNSLFTKVARGQFALC